MILQFFMVAGPYLVFIWIPDLISDKDVSTSRSFGLPGAIGRLINFLFTLFNNWLNARVRIKTFSQDVDRRVFKG